MASRCPGELDGVLPPAAEHLKLDPDASLQLVTGPQGQDMTGTSPRGVLPLVALLLLSAVGVHADGLTLAVANSTCKAIKRIGHMYQQQHDVTLKYLCKSSGLLARGLHGDAIHADIYISANREWMDYLVDAELVSPEQVVSPWGNELVVATPLSSRITDFDWRDLASERVGSILIGDPGSAPFGRYTKQALMFTDLWRSVRHKIQTKKNVSLLAETLAEASPDTIGILFLSNVSDSLRVIHTVDPSWHAAIQYCLAPLKRVQTEAEVISLLDYLQSDAARAVFRKEGFRLATP
jgi:molybdate transport system substrate-binding protein